MTTTYTLYTAATPNGQKISIALEELRLDYAVRVIDLPAGEQRQPWYVALNPNGRIPTLVDHSAGDFAIFESGAILAYLADKHGALMPNDSKGKSLVMQWLMFQMGGVGPMMGQANVFHRYMPERIQPAIDRFQGESKRLLGVLDARLAANDYLAGAYSIADIAHWCWARLHFWAGVDIDDLPHLTRWLQVVGEREAVQRGAKVPDDILLRLQDTRADDIKRTAANMVVTAAGH